MSIFKTATKSTELRAKTKGIEYTDKMDKAKKDGKCPFTVAELTGESERFSFKYKNNDLLLKVDEDELLIPAPKDKSPWVNTFISDTAFKRDEALDAYSDIEINEMWNGQEGFLKRPSTGMSADGIVIGDTTYRISVYANTIKGNNGWNISLSIKLTEQNENNSSSTGFEKSQIRRMA